MSCFILLFLVFPFLHACLQNGGYDRPKVEKTAKNVYANTLHVVTDIDYTPFSYVDEDGAYAGYDVELIIEIANRLEMNLDLRLLDWPEAQHSLMQGSANIIMNMETDIVANDPAMIATIPTIEKQYVVYGRKKVTSIADLLGHKVVSLHHLPELGMENAITYLDSYADVFLGLKLGTYDFAVCPVQVGDYFLNKLNLEDVFGSYAVAHVYGALALLSHETALKERLNTVICDLWLEGEIDRLNEKWIRHTYMPMTLHGLLARFPWIWALMAVLLFSFFLLIVYSRFQRRNAEINRVYTEQLQRHLVHIKEQQRSLEEARRSAEEGSRAKTIFLSNMSHDIRTPMNAIIGFTNLALRPSTRVDEMRSYLMKIDAASRHLLSLINDILEMSRIESGKIELHAAPLQLPELLHELRTFLQAQVAEKKQSICIDACAVYNESVIVDRLRLNQVLLNLASNAVKYTPAGGRISIRLSQLKAGEGTGDYEFRVKDNGIGMTKEFAVRIFDAFERERSSTISGIQGTGLGMAIAKHIVEMMGGSVRVDTEKGQGTEVTIRLTLPLATENAFATTFLPLQRILVVDDEQGRTCVCGMLKRLGLEVMAVEDEDSALDIARKMKEKGTPIEAVCMPLGQIQAEFTAGKVREGSFVARLAEEADNGRPLFVFTGYEAPREDLPSGMIFCERPLFASDLRRALLTLCEKRDENADKQSQQNEDDAREDFSGVRVLLVDDVEVNREIAATIFEVNGFLVDQACDGSEAVEKIQKADSDYYKIVLMDIQMPVMDGYEATRAIRALSDPVKSKLPIFAISANAFDKDVKASLAAGMNGHLSKPLDSDVLLRTVKKALFS
ncbi:MAG: response regulator [Desulfovibrio sp.]|nr:response regulator [Desulfovibrio sp.]